MNTYNFYTSRDIKPLGWVKRQLEIQADGLAGNLDKVWRDVRDSAWIGGEAEGWERVPYWLDGFIPLAYLLADEDKIARAKKYIDAILAHMKPDGWICPCADDARKTYDTWAIQLISKVLTVYYECSSDERIPDVLYRVMKNYYDLLSRGEISLFNWGKYRWYEAFVALNFLYKKYEEEWIRDLARILRDQGVDVRSLTPHWKRPINKWTYDTHIVNIAMMLKYEALTHDLLGEEYTDTAEELVSILREYNGTAVGLFTGDECLSGVSPIQGTELCAVVEQMYSYEHLFATTGDRKWAERLELLAFNALPATISDDMWTHQYLQMSNQISTERLPGRSLFRTNNSTAHMFGLEPNYGCCTANFGQGWPKLVLSSFMHSNDTVISGVPIPSVLDTDGFTVKLETEYPFDNKFVYTVDARRAFELKVRIPLFARRLTVLGRTVPTTEELTFEFNEGDKAVIDISYTTVPEMFDRPHSLKSVRCGSLVFALPISYEKKMYEYVSAGVERKFPYCDYEYIPTSEWSYAYSSPSFSLEARGVTDVPFNSENPPVVVKAEVKSIQWGLEEGFETVAAKIPESRTPISEAKSIDLYPYGCAKLRMTELPLV